MPKGFPAPHDAKLPNAWAWAAHVDGVSLAQLRSAAADCRACELWRCGTQTVFGAGQRTARMLLIGEQPGEAEDRCGRPFVGPAGRLLRHALEAVGLQRQDVYLTNVVKHPRWERRGRGRVDKRPRPGHIRACLPWLMAEIDVVRPAVIVCLGDVAAQALLGAAVRVRRDRGRVFHSPLAPAIVVTVHPAILPRQADGEAPGSTTQRFIDDLRVAKSALRKPPTKRKPLRAAPHRRAG